MVSALQDHPKVHLLLPPFLGVFLRLLANTFLLGVIFLGTTSFGSSSWGIVPCETKIH
jgi:hypothetical protein